jgi:hypothetical protein
VINATAPVPVTNREFQGTGDALDDRHGRQSRFVLRTLFGELADAALLNGQRGSPGSGTPFQFEFHGRTGAAESADLNWLGLDITAGRASGGLRLDGGDPHRRMDAPEPP